MHAICGNCLTSVSRWFVAPPPYWGLRKYSGLTDLVWGDKDCEHQWDTSDRWLHRGSTKSPIEAGRGRMTEARTTDNFCSLCGAWRGSYGLEPTPEMYIEHTIEILREIRRVLRKDGVVFWNIGDSYAAGKGTCFNPGGGKGSFSTHGDRKDAGIYPLDRGNVSMLRAWSSQTQRPLPHSFPCSHSRPRRWLVGKVGNNLVKAQSYAGERY